MNKEKAAPISKLISIKELKLNPNNPRIIKDDKFAKLVASITAAPWMLHIRPIVVNADYVVLGGNMRLRACEEAGLKKVPVLIQDELSTEEQNEFIIKDNVGFGEWDWDILANDWDAESLEEWGLTNWQDMDDINTEDSFELSDADKGTLQQQTYTLADEQALQVSNAIVQVKESEEFNYVETYGNENSNGNALYLIIMQWISAKK